MKCPNPSCKQEILCLPNEDFAKLTHCPRCNTKLEHNFRLEDFLSKNVNLFTIFGIFVAMVIILPTFSQISINTAANFTQPFPGTSIIVKEQFLPFLNDLFIISCTFLALMAGFLIVFVLFSGSRQRELIFWEWGTWNIRTNDFQRIVFAFPFFILMSSVFQSLIITTGLFFSGVFLVFLIVLGVVFYLRHRH